MGAAWRAELATAAAVLGTWVLVATLALSINGCATAPTKLAAGGAYRPEASQPGLVTLYHVDLAYRLASGTVDSVFQWEYDHRPSLLAIDPGIKAALDEIRPKALAADRAFHEARTAYLSVATNAPPGAGSTNAMAQLEQALHTLQSLATAVAAVDVPAVEAAFDE